MSNIFLIDSDILSKFGRTNNLHILEAVPGQILITREIYSEIVDGANFGAPGAVAALSWLDSNANNPNIAVSRVYLTKSERNALYNTNGDAGELSIDKVLNQAFAMADPNTFVVLSDSPQARVVAGFLNATGGVFYGYEMAGSLLAQGFISPEQYFDALERLQSLGPEGIGGTAMFGPPVVVYGTPYGIYDAGTRDVFGIPEGDPVGTVTYFEDGGFIVRLDGEEPQYFKAGRQVGYQDGQLMDMASGSPVPAVPDDGCFSAGTLITMWDGSKRVIEDVSSNDFVLSYDRSGSLSNGRVVRTFIHDVTHLLNVHGLKVTPGHVTLCGDGQFSGQHVPIIDILLSDGALVRENGGLVRMAINKPVGSREDQFVQVSYAVDADAARKGNLQSGKMRVGTLLFDREGQPVSVLDCIRAEGMTFYPETGLVSREGGLPEPLYFFGELPRPEDYILRRSRKTLEGILTDGEWESTPSQLVAQRLRQTKSLKLH